MAENPFLQFQSEPRDVLPGAGDLGDNPFPLFKGGEGPTPPPMVPPDVLKPPVQQPNLYQSTYENPMLGAEQRAVPHPERYGSPLATGKDVFVNDAGEISYRDVSGEQIPTDRAQHVILQGPEGLSVYARTPQTRESPIEGAARVLSLGIGAPTPGLPTMAAEATIPRLREAATAVYESPAVARTNFNPAALGEAFREVAPRLERMDPRSIQRIQGELNNLGPTVNDLNIASERLGVIAGETTGPIGRQQATPDAAAAQIVKQQIDKVIRATAPAMAEADKNYAAMKAAQTITGRGDVAEVQARGGDFAKRMETQATQLLLDKRTMAQLTPEETEMVRALSRGELKGEGLKNAAQWMSGKFGMALGIGAGIAGFQHSGPVTAALSATAGAMIDPAISSFLRNWGNRLAANQVNALTESIRARSPLGQDLRNKVATFGDAQSGFLASKTQGSLAALRSASRDLSVSLRRLGVDIHPAQLMRGSQADENQQQVPGPPR